MAGERALITGVFSILIDAGLLWVVAEAIDGWSAAGLPSVISDDDEVSARQASMVVEAIEKTLLPQLDAAQFLRRNTDHGSFAFDVGGDVALASIDTGASSASDSDRDVFQVFEEFVTAAREQIRGEWPQVEWETDL